MTRPTIPSSFDVYPQYYSIVTDQDGNALGQLRSIQGGVSVTTTQAGRIGSSTKKTLRKSKEGTVSLSVWMDSDLAEIAEALNAASSPGSGETVQLDPEATARTLYIKRYDGEASSSTLLDILYLYNYTATEWSLSLDEDGEQVSDISGTCEDMYAIRA